jgi:hypothetical protein
VMALDETGPDDLGQDDAGRAGGCQRSASRSSTEAVPLL